ncbi:L,D-transpeptidase family protein [Spirillospora sp. CA-294931]|uniref:L,D-transpeptidase family protein n=1 Tax=Spirillospora sp. CA-294931 TaxID=3240042 RepID=UPI003D8AA9E9
MIAGIALAASVLLPLAPATAAPDRTPQIRALQQRLHALRYDPGPVNGVYGTRTLTAVWAFQKVNGMAPTGKSDARFRWALAHPRSPRPLVRRGAPDRVEIDLSRQLLVAYRKGRVALITHVSTGSGRRYCEKGVCGVARTPIGDFRAFRRINGWRKSRLGFMYRPVYFFRGYAIHGSISVPRRPASHGCVRVPMHTADRLPGLIRHNEPVHVRR